VLKQDENLASGSNEYSIRIWDTKNGQTINTFDGHTGCVNCTLAWMQNGSLASGSDAQTILL
jgi:WD40 repeat protein